MWLIFLSRSMERQAGHGGKTVVMTDSKEKENFFEFERNMNFLHT